MIVIGGGGGAFHGQPRHCQHQKRNAVSARETSNNYKHQMADGGNARVSQSSLDKKKELEAHEHGS